MSDGSNMGITAGRALGTIIGGDPQPSDEEQASKEEVRKRVMSAPSPGEKMEFDYSLAADAIAKAFLLVEEKYPGTLEEKVFYADDYEYEPLRGKPHSPETAIWRKTSEEYPGFDDWVGGASGFMVGFAYNTARWLNDKPVVQNPAIITIGE